MALKPFAVVPLPFTVLTSTTPYAGFPASNLAEFRHIGMVWRVPPNPFIAVNVDFGAAVNIDFAAIVAANGRPATKFIVRIGNDPTFATSSYSSGTAQSFLGLTPFVENGTYSSHLEIPSPVSGRYARIEIFDHDVDFIASMLVFGLKKSFANYYSPGFEFGTEDLGDIDIGRWGVPDVTDGLIFRRLTCKFGWMSRSDMDTNFGPLVEQVGKRTPIHFVMDPEATTYRNRRTYFGWLKEPPFFTGAVNKFDRFESEWSIISMI